MTPEILEYLLRATVIWLALLAYYFVAGRKASFRFQRFFLLGGWLFGLLVPLLPGLEGEVSLPVANLPTISFAGPAAAAMTVEIVAESTLSFTDFLPWLYLFGVLIFGARPLVHGWLTEQYMRTGQRSTFSGYPVIRHPGIRSPFAARGYVFLPAGMTDASLENTALLHESSHLRARHHYDKFLLTLGSTLLWFHPLTWVYQRLLATVHEYEADAAVLRQVPARTYGLQLLHCSLGPTRGLGLFSSPLKQRIEMITNKTSGRKLRLLPLLGLCLLLLGLAAACSDITEDLQPPTQEEIPGLQVLDIGPELTLVPDEYPKPIKVVNEAPTLETLIKSIYQNIKYPVAARAAGENGFVRLNVVFSETGAVLSINIIGLSSEDDEDETNNLVVVGYSDAPAQKEAARAAPFADELDRLINELAPFTPAKVNGEAVPFSMNFDIQFKLE
ncbi:M56 family metallopeptidase [Neolewinella persica]|uniref:M56 family metallopeptidase n=1 Tax=Neolewinella persica TaxID=70998 RepID=UPI00035E1045|nr:M56 family metallopeptidase [Neolewinella persica]